MQAKTFSDISLKNVEEAIQEWLDSLSNKKVVSCSLSYGGRHNYVAIVIVENDWGDT